MASRTATSLLGARNAANVPPVAHVVRDDSGSRRGPRAESSPRPSGRRTTGRAARQRVNHSGHWRAAAVLDVRRRARDRARGRYAAEERRRDVGDALRDELHVRTMAASDHPVGHDGREQRLDGRQHRDREGRPDQRRHLSHRDVAASPDAAAPAVMPAEPAADGLDGQCKDRPRRPAGSGDERPGNSSIPRPDGQNHEQASRQRGGRIGAG